MSGFGKENPSNRRSHSLEGLLLETYHLLLLVQQPLQISLIRRVPSIYSMRGFSFQSGCNTIVIAMPAWRVADHSRLKNKLRTYVNVAGQGRLETWMCVNAARRGRIEICQCVNVARPGKIEICTRVCVVSRWPKKAYSFSGVNPNSTLEYTSVLWSYLLISGTLVARGGP